MNNFIVKNFLWKVIKRLANLNLSLSILSLIALCCIVGSIIEQEQEVSYYSLNYSSYSTSILYFGFNHVFSTWWFIFILFIFILSLLSCTFFTQLPTLKNARRWKFMYNTNNLNVSSYVVSNYPKFNYSFTNIIYALIRVDFFVFSRSGSIYSYKGLYGRIAPIFVHFSIVTILFGSIYSFLSSFMVQELVPRGELFHIKNIVHAGLSSRLPSDLLFHIDDFYIDYNINNSIKQFFSLISIYGNNQKIINSKLVFVNKPLRLHQISMYQTDWQVDAIRISVGKDYSIQKQLLKTNLNNNNCWVAGFVIENKKQIFFVIRSLENRVLICDLNGLVLGEAPFGKQFYINRIPVIIQDVITSTGIQIKSDPGIYFVYLGFLIMILSTFTSYISYSQIWINTSINNVNVFGSTNRAILLFEQETFLLQRIYSSYIFLRGIVASKINFILR